MRILITIIIIASCFNVFSQNKKPNVILVLTDDQGIGDLGCHGNPWLKTPNIDSFYKESVRFTDFHVSPVCTPTRGAIMSGRYPINNGAWATYKGRDALSEGAITMADLFKKGGYKTGMFGKWHLGDNYPVRPTDCGFDVAVHHKAGGVGELSDYWGNNYFNDIYYVNNEPKQFEGYCTDVWFNEAMKFIENNKEKPFFIYLPTNAPHGPHYVDEKYAKPYREKEGTEIVNAKFFGMIANIDENFGKLEKFLKEQKLADNTILIFMTDNGATGGVSRDEKRGYNMGLRGRKGHRTDGGHLVPFFIRWKDGKIKGGKDISETTAHVDLMPTLASLCNLNIPESKKLDGVDLTSLFNNKKGKLDERSVFVHSRQDWRPPTDVVETCIVNGKWRLVHGKELYNVENDRKQLNDISAQNSKIVEKLLVDNSKFLKISKLNSEYNQIPSSVIGNKNQKEIKLTIQHAIGEDRGIWKSEQVAAGMKNTNNTHALKIEKNGTYLISCRRWPKECSGPILGIPSENPKNWFDYKTISPEKIRISIANQMFEKEIGVNDEEVVFEVNLKKGKTFLVNDFIEGKEKYGVYYTYISNIGS
ncbi:arylsulfatase [uncultured Lutibacter sp.]|uniref:arylsulfatase n=1 Tax=uncultured Lutibacter sp. TaxID=437739 RepID=UPI002615CBB6|nr:arylsulfatase [uncultured Lutibacter sp.]